MNPSTIKLIFPILVAGAAAWAQTQPPAGQIQNPPPPPQQGDNGAAPQPGRGFRSVLNQQGRGGVPPALRGSRPPLERSLPQGRWWNNPDVAQKLSLTADQQKKMDEIFLQNRLRLVDLNATLQKEEITMEPMMGADMPDEAKVLAQIDKVAQARAELEKANARFLLGIRRVLTPEQWKKLQAETARRDGGRGPGQGGLGRPSSPPPTRKGG